MNGRLRRRDPRFPTFWSVQIVGWICFYASALVTELPNIKTGGLWGGSAFVATAFVASCLLRPACRSLVQQSLSWIAMEIGAFAWSVPAGIVSGYVAGFLTGHHAPGWVDWLETGVQASFILFVWCSLYISLKLWQQSIREQERLLRAESEVRDARLSALRFQLNPHFLFNSLNAASTLVLDGNASAATKMLAQIADFLRTILDSEAVPEATLSREILYAEQYLAIEQTRLGSRLHVEMDVAPETMEALVPNMLLQPLVENAVRHGIARLVEGGTIRVSSEIRGPRLKISVWNSSSSVDLPRADAMGSGVGLRNTAARLKTLYGADYALVLPRAESGGCEAGVELPLRFKSSESALCAR